MVLPAKAPIEPERWHSLRGFVPRIFPNEEMKEQLSRRLGKKL